MPRQEIDTLPDDARIFLFGSDRPLGANEEKILLATTDAHLDGWAAHGQPIVSGRSWLEGHFLAVAVDEQASGVSGCSIDALFAHLQHLESRLDTKLTDRGRVWYRDGSGAVNSADRPAFAGLMRSGAIDRETRVFDLTIGTLGDLRSGKLEKPLHASWHARAFLAGAAR